jgi:hypothetical protein
MNYESVAMTEAVFITYNHKVPKKQLLSSKMECAYYKFKLAEEI